jgi:hypothetical protein
VDAPPLPDAPPAAVPSVGDQGPETFDLRPMGAQVGPSPRTVQLVAGVGGAVLLVVGLLLVTVFPLGEPDPTFGQKVIVPLALLVLGASFLGMAVWSARFAREGIELRIDADRVELRYSRGSPGAFRWDDPELEVRLSHVVEVPPGPRAGVGWVLIQRGSTTGWTSAITLDASAALIRRAPTVGLETTNLRRELRRSRGRQAAFEVTVLARPGKAHLPGPDWNPVTVSPNGSTPVEAPAMNPSRKGPPEAYSPKKPPRVPHC